jgi:hypothetical protein
MLCCIAPDDDDDDDHDDDSDDEGDLTRLVDEGDLTSLVDDDEGDLTRLVDEGDLEPLGAFIAPPLPRRVLLRASMRGSGSTLLQKSNLPSFHLLAVLRVVMNTLPFMHSRMI